MSTLTQKMIVILGIISILCVPVYLITHILWVGIIGYGAILIQGMAVLCNVVFKRRKTGERHNERQNTD